MRWILLILLIACCCQFPVSHAVSQETATGTPRKFSSLELWKYAYETFEQAEELGIQGKNDESLKKFKSALDNFNRLKKRKSPKFNNNVINYRIKLCKRRIKSLNWKINFVKQEIAKKATGEQPKTAAKQTQDAGKTNLAIDRKSVV